MERVTTTRTDKQLIRCTAQQLATLHGYAADMRDPSNPQPIGSLHWTEAYKVDRDGVLHTDGTFQMKIDPDGTARVYRDGAVCVVSYGLHELERHTVASGPACLLWGRGAYATHAHPTT